MRYLSRKRIVILLIAALPALLLAALVTKDAQVFDFMDKAQEQSLSIERANSLNVPNNGRADVFVNVKRFPSDVPKEVVDQVVELERVVDASETSQTPSVSTSEAPNTVGALLNGTESASIVVKTRALELLAEVVKEGGATQSEINQLIRPAMEQIVASSTPGDEQAALSKTRAERVLWQLDALQLTEQERLNFLKDNMENTSDGSFYYSFEAIDQLAEIGSVQARGILEDLLGQRTERSISNDILTRATFAIEKINAILDTESLAAQQQADHLQNLIVSNKDAVTLHHREFLVWLVGRLEAAQTTEASQVLREIWNDDSYDLDIRTVAQESLVGLGEIGPEERTIIGSDF